jgi:hypothetical protein
VKAQIDGRDSRDSRDSRDIKAPADGWNATILRKY